LTALPKKIIPILIVLIAVAADQVTKALIRANVPLYAEIPEDSFICITHTENTGVAFSLLSGGGPLLLILQSVLVLAVGAAFIWAIIKSDSTLMNCALALMLGGGIGNLIDRAAQGSVTDFISVGTFPVFNTADACLVTGCALMILYLILSSRPPRHCEERSDEAIQCKNNE
jgi:signal peptidase II